MSKTTKKVRLAIIGTGGMAHRHAECFSTVPGCQLVAACDVLPERAKAFAEKFAIPNVYSDSAMLLAKADIDAVSIVAPDPFHAPLAIQALKAGKHVLCEKPLAEHFRDAHRMTLAAKKAGVVNMVNFSYRDLPSLQGLAAAVSRGEIGEIRHVEASYLQAWLASKIWGDWRTSPHWLWRLSSGHGSKGVLGDVGVHIVDFATYPAGPIKDVFCRLKSFPKAPGNRIGDYELDANDSAVLNVEFANGALGILHTSRWVGGHANRLSLKIAGTEGSISLDTDLSTNIYRICNGAELDTCQWREVQCPSVPTNYERFISAIRTGNKAEPDFARGAEVQSVLDACFVSQETGQPVRLKKLPPSRG